MKKRFLFLFSSVFTITSSLNPITIYDYSSRGARPTQEDSLSIEQNDNFIFFAVFDGHGGSKCSKYLKEHLLTNITNKFNFNKKNSKKYTLKNLLECIYNSFIETNINFIKSWTSILKPLPGSTAIIGFIIDNYLIIANAGDCRAILYSEKDKDSGIITQLSHDHKASDPIEQEKVKLEGGRIYVFEGCKRVDGLLAVSRSFGDPYITGITPYPEITVKKLTENDKYVVMASDGLWDDLLNKEVFKLIYNKTGNLAQILVKKIEKEYFRGMDNTTTIALKNIFNPNSSKNKLKSKLKDGEIKLFSNEREADDLIIEFIKITNTESDTETETSCSETMEISTDEFVEVSPIKFK